MDLGARQATLRIAFLGNAGFFAAELCGALALGPATLEARGLDCLADAALFTASLSGLRAAAHPRSRAALLSRAATLTLGVATLWSVAYHVTLAATLHSVAMSILGALTLAMNGALLSRTQERRARVGEIAALKVQGIGTVAGMIVTGGASAVGTQWPEVAGAWVLTAIGAVLVCRTARHAPRQMQTAVVSGGCLALNVASAQAHGIAGNRLFPATLTFDDPAVADELFAPSFSRQHHPVPNGGTVLDDSVGASLSRVLLPGLALGADAVWTEHDAADAKPVRGFGPTHLSLKTLLYEDDPHETLVSGSLAWGIGGLGNPELHATSYSTINPAVTFGRGFGDVPAGIAWLRPFGLAGGVSLEVPATGRSRPSPGAAPIGNPIILHTGITLEYSTLYLTDRFTGGPPSAEPLNQFVPLIELQFDSPVGGGFGTKTSGTLNPGIAYVDETYQLSLEAIVPLNRRGGSPGFRAGAVFFLDDLVPSLFGKPVFH